MVLAEARARENIPRQHYRLQSHVHALARAPRRYLLATRYEIARLFWIGLGYDCGVAEKRWRVRVLVADLGEYCLVMTLAL